MLLQADLLAPADERAGVCGPGDLVYGSNRIVPSY